MQIGWSLQQFKEGFLSSSLIEAYLDPAAKKAASHMGGYVRRVARNSLKYEDGSAAAGQPPKVHKFFNRKKTNRKTGVVSVQAVSPLRELLFFAYDRSAKSVVVGPMLFPSSAKKVKGPGPVPGTLERGGTVRITKDVPVVRGRLASRRQYDAFLLKVQSGQIVRKPAEYVTTVTTKKYPPHPFMAPALARTLPRFADFFQNSVRAT